MARPPHSYTIMRTLFIVVLVAFILMQTVYGFTFRAPTDDADKVSRDKRRQSVQQIIFGIISTSSTTIKTTTTAAPTTVALTSQPMQFSTAMTNLTGNRNENSSTLQNSTSKTSVFEGSSNSTIVNASSTTAGVKPEACQPRIDQGTTMTSYLSDIYIRSRLCPNVNSSLLREYRFDLDAKICSQVGNQSHCGKNMIFYSYARNEIYGYCDCDYSTAIPLLYHPDTNRCYFMYQQGYCGEEEWLEMIKENGTTVCTKNKCYNNGRTPFGAPPLAARDVAPEYVPLRGNGPCVKLNQPSPQFCRKEGDIVTFRWPFEFYPNCGKPVKKPLLPPEGPTGRFLGEVTSPSCNPGSYLNVVGICQPEFEFD